MRIGLFSLLILALGFSGCKTYDAVEYFGEDRLGDNWSAASFAGYLNVFHEKPIALEASEEGQSVYRYLVLQPSNPVYLIKVETKLDGSAKVSIKQTPTGYRRTTSKRIAKSDTVHPTKTEVEAYLAEMSSSDFWRQDEATQYDFRDDFFTHPPFFLFEGQSTQGDVSYYDFDPHLRKNTAKIASAFYSIAGLDAEDEWTRAGYFSEYLNVDWEFEDE